MAIRKTLRGSTYRRRIVRKLFYSLVSSPDMTITSTMGKMKFFQSKLEKIIHKTKNKMNLSLLRTLVSFLYNDVVLARKFIKKVDSLYYRPGGYTRVLRANYRKDGAPVGIISLCEDAVSKKED